MINLKHKKIINKVVWVWTTWFKNDLFDDTPEQLQYYFNQEYTIKDYSSTIYKE